MIAATGERMMPIGRWKPAVELLVARGYLARHGCPGDPTGQFNCIITDAGRAASEEAEYVADQELLTAFSAIGKRGQAFRTKLEQGARCLHDAARVSAHDLKRSLTAEIERLGAELVGYAQELAAQDSRPLTPSQRMLKELDNDTDAQG